MSSQTMSAALFTGGENDGNIRGWVIFAGVMSLVLGTAAIIYNGTATVASVLVFGALLAIGGVAQIVSAVYVRYWSGVFLYLLGGVIRTTVGALLVGYPTAGAGGPTLVVWFFLFAGRLFHPF